jgi:hypothetical protein
MPLRTLHSQLPPTSISAVILPSPVSARRLRPAGPRPKNLRLRKEHWDRGSVSLSTLGNVVQERQASHEKNRFCLRHIKEENEQKNIDIATDYSWLRKFTELHVAI